MPSAVCAQHKSTDEYRAAEGEENHQPEAFVVAIAPRMRSVPRNGKSTPRAGQHLLHLPLMDETTDQKRGGKEDGRPFVGPVEIETPGHCKMGLRSALRHSLGAPIRARGRALTGKDVGHGCG